MPSYNYIMSKTFPVPCTKEEIDALIACAIDNPFYYTLFNLAKTTGRRLGEYVGTPEKVTVRREEYVNSNGVKKIREIKRPNGKYIGGIRVKDIDFEKNMMNTMILKRRQREEKEAILRPDISLMLRQFIMTNRLKDDDYVFRGVSYRAIQAAVASYAKKAGINHKVSFHNFRHYFVTSLLKQGWHYEKIVKLTGHSTPQTLVHYDHVIASDIEEEAQEAIKEI